jgi:hypothetical protein
MTGDVSLWLVRIDSVVEKLDDIGPAIVCHSNQGRKGFRRSSYLATLKSVSV